MSEKTSCRLCGEESSFFHAHLSQNYHRCSNCQLIQVNGDNLPTRVAERAEYELHENGPHQAGYRRFLEPVTQLALEWLAIHELENPQILDFGCGPGPALSVVLGERGWPVTNYDPIFQPCPLIPHTFNLVLCTEVVEHFHFPHQSWSKLISLLAPDGMLIVMTEWADKHQSKANFHLWPYIRERSHVALYHSNTFKWVAHHYHMSLSYHAPRVVCFQKSSKMDAHGETRSKII